MAPLVLKFKSRKPLIFRGGIRRGSVRILKKIATDINQFYKPFGLNLDTGTDRDPCYFTG